ncbi:MAG: polysulfide reductase [Deltaproteobacteria bacterium HGW-Deltaproteobacteria-12]|jgi:molybdopterin-containing oxidoreductase family membrane subunit|nr:MAG: polysulfide reductase [Deltaproteobacteria bacterium HGW-Deltaproteobacteria-12]
MENTVNSPVITGIKDALNRVISGGPVYLFLLTAFVILLIAGVISGIYSIFIAGTLHSYGTFREIPLALLIATYIFFVVASTGLCLVSSIGHVFGNRDFLPIAKRSVLLALITIISGFLVIALEIENPFRMLIYFFTSPNFSSNIWWMGALYMLYMIFMAIEFVLLMRESHRVAAFFGFLSVISGVAAHSNLGGIFAMLHGRDIWYGPFLPVYFILSAMMTGSAFIIFFSIIAQKIRNTKMDEAEEKSLALVGKLAMLMIAAIVFLTVWKLITMTTGGETHLLTLHETISGSHAFSFWVLEVACGMIIPFFLLWRSSGRKRGLMMTAAALMIFSIFFMRLDLVIMAQIVPLYWDLGVKEFSQLHTYAPTWKEILVALGGVGFCGAAFMLGEKVFNGFSEAPGIEDLESGKAESEL